MGEDVFIVEHDNDLTMSDQETASVEPVLPSLDTASIDPNVRRWLLQSRPRSFIVALQTPLDDGFVDTSIRSDKIAWIHSDPSFQTHLTPVLSPLSLKADGFTALTVAVDDFTLLASWVGIRAWAMPNTSLESLYNALMQVSDL